MRYLHKACGTPLSYVKKCPSCETEVPYEDITKGYEYDKGRFVLFEKEELDALSEDSSREIEILDFVDLQDIDPVYFQKTYYLAPGDTGSNAYQLLLEALKQTGKIGIAKVTLRSKSSLAALRVVNRCIAMETIFFPDEIRAIEQVPNLPQKTEVKEQELKMAKMLIDQLSAEFEPEKYQNDYRHRLLEQIEHKISGEEIKIAPVKEESNIIDLMTALQASLEKVNDDKKPTTKKKKAKEKDKVTV